MLHKSFKPAKCKTALKLSVSRIKLLKNKKEALLKQQRRELAQLLESGQERTARIRVEHVVREEKNMAAYDLIEIYCELIVARMPIIESQKHCPIDLKEAIASVIFASPRCADIPELMDVRKHFTAKYGKEFVAAALEIRPDCGVSRLLVEKLSVKAPDGPTKIKILTAIAEEHNVKWDRESFEENEMKPPEDLLNGPNTFGQASKMHVEPSNLQERPSSNDRVTSNSGASSKHYERHDGPNSKSSLYSQNYPSTAVDASKAMPSGISHPHPRPLRNTSEAMESGYFYASGQDPSGGQSWTMEFKDATTAAQAAAESAERASMAARAAAELSSRGRITRQHSAEPNKASVLRSTDEQVQNYASSRSQGEHMSPEPAHNSALRSNTRMHCGQTYADEEEEDLSKLTERFNNLKRSTEPTRTASSKSSSSAAGDYSHASDLQTVHGRSRNTPSTVEKSDLLDEGEASMKAEGSKSDEEFAGEAYSGIRTGNVGFFEQASIGEQSSNVSSHSQSQIRSGDFNVFSNVTRQEFIEDAFNEHSIFNKVNVGRNTEETNAYGNPDVVFDDSGSEDDVYKFDEKVEDNEQDSYSYFSSGSRKSSSHLLANTSTKSPGLTMEYSHGNSFSKTPFSEESTSIFSEGLASDRTPSQELNFLHVTFDDSDGLDSDSEVELNKSEVVGRKPTDTSPHKDNSYSSFPETPKSSHSMQSSFPEKLNMRYDRNTEIHASVVDLGEVHSPRNQGTEAGDEETDRKLGYDYLYDNQASQRPSKSYLTYTDNEKIRTADISSAEDDIQGVQLLKTSDGDEHVKEPSLGSGKELKFGNLTGGLRNKGYKHPPYRRNPLEKQSVSRPTEDNSTRIDQSPSSLEAESGFEARDQTKHGDVNEKSSSRVPYSDATDESDEWPQQAFYSTQESHIQKAGNKMNKKPGASSYFDSGNSDSDDDLSRRTGTSKTHSSPVFSRRTKASSSDFRRNSNAKSSFLPESSNATDSVAKNKSTSSVSSFSAETPAKTPYDSVSSDYRGRSEQSSSSQSSRSSRGSYTTDSSLQSKILEQHRSAESIKPVLESKRPFREETPKALAREKPSNPPLRRVEESRPEAPSRENSIDRASHVHPKLPDYDTLTAHLLSLRQNRQ